MKNYLDWIKEKFKSVNQKFKARENELKLQAKEYERRLEGLNHEAERLKDMQKTYITRELFDRTMDLVGQRNEKEVNALRERIERDANALRERIDGLNSWKTKQEGKAQLMQYIPWILTAISIILLYTKR